MNGKKITLASLVMLCLGLMVYAEVTITPPKITFTATDPAYADLAGLLNDQFDSTLGGGFDELFSTLKTEVNDQLAPYSNLDKLALGFVDANLASAQSATMQGYQGYKIFAVTSGVMVGGQMPSLDPSSIMTIANDIMTNPNVYVGVAPSIAFLNIGVNAGKLVGIFSPDLGEKLKNLYFTGKFGMLSYTYVLNNSPLVLNTGNFGFGINYQILAHSPSLLGGLFMWRGVNIATGINYQTNTIDYTMSFGKISQDFTTDVSYTVGGFPLSTTASATMSLTPEATLGLNLSTLSIPLEATTSAQILWLANINLGIGVDFAFGSSSLIAKGTSAIKIDNLNSGVDQVTATAEDGSITIDSSTTGVTPTLLRPRISAGLGLNLGPVKIDVPVYYYFNNGFAAGLSLGFVW